MKDFKRIMVPIDGSTESKNALMHAIYLARICDAEVYLAAVVDLNRFVSALELVSTGGFVPNKAREKGERRLDKIMPMIPDDVKTIRLVDTGSPAETLLALTYDNDIDLVVMGRRGKNTLERIAMGSVSQYMVANAHCPVLVVK